MNTCNTHIQYLQEVRARLRSNIKPSFAYICLHADVYIHTYTHTFVLTCNIHIYTSYNIHIYICTYTYMHTYTLF